MKKDEIINKTPADAKLVLGEVYLVKKGKKFMKGHGYSTLNGYKFNQTNQNLFLIFIVISMYYF